MQVFCIFPQYNLARGLYQVYYNANVKALCTESPEFELICEVQNLTYVIDPYSTPEGGVGRYLISLSLLIPVLFALLALIEFEVARPTIRPLFKRICTCCFRKKQKRVSTPHIAEDEDPDSDVTVSDWLDFVCTKMELKSLYSVAVPEIYFLKFAQISVKFS